MSYEGLFGKELYSERTFPTNYDVLKYDKIPKKLRVQIFQQMLTIHMDGDLQLKENEYTKEDIFYNIMLVLKQRRGVLSYKDLLPDKARNELEYRNHVRITAPYLAGEELEFYTLLIFADSSDYLLILDLIELLSYWMNDILLDWSSETVDSMINELFRINGVGYELINNMIIHKGNEIIHKNIVRPTLYFLSDPTYSGANSEMLQAFKDFKQNNFKGAIHNANNAFESTMKIIIEKNNWQLVTPNPLQSVPTLPKATASVLIHTIDKNAALESFELSTLKGLKDTLQALATLRNSHAGHGQGQK